jgi:hypothetical protein
VRQRAMAQSASGSESGSQAHDMAGQENATVNGRLTQEAIDLAITDLDPDLPWNRIPQPFAAAATRYSDHNRNLARHRREIAMDQLVRSAIAVAFVMALLAGGFAMGYLAK